MKSVFRPWFPGYVRRTSDYCSGCVFQPHDCEIVEPLAKSKLLECDERPTAANHTKIARGWLVVQAPRAVIS